MVWRLESLCDCLIVFLKRMFLILLLLAMGDKTIFLCIDCPVAYVIRQFWWHMMTLN